MALPTFNLGSELALDEVMKTYGGRPAVDGVSLTVKPQEFVTVLGPSGSGKTTVLRMIGGFVVPDSGRILIDGSDVASVPVERRPTAMLFQQLSLWPHLTAARNISFGLEIRHRPKREIEKRVGELLEIVGLADFGSRLPSQLSGGEQQRVALARALALEPRILLLDEPFSALDTKLRIELRNFVRNLQREVGTTTLLVTHDQEEALELSDRIVVMRNGRVEQIGAPAEIYDTPETAFVAEFLGAMNFFTGSITDAYVVISDRTAIPLIEPTGAQFKSVKIGVRPEDIVVDAEHSTDSGFVVEAIIPKGHYQQLTIRWHGGLLTSYVTKGNVARPGERVGVCFRRIQLFPEDAEGERADADDNTARWCEATREPRSADPVSSTYGANE